MFLILQTIKNNYYILKLAKIKLFILLYIILSCTDYIINNNYATIGVLNIFN